MRVAFSKILTTDLETDENFPGHRFETQIHIQTQIRLNTIVTSATKHLMIANKNNLYLHLKIL